MIILLLFARDLSVRASLLAPAIKHYIDEVSAAKNKNNDIGQSCVAFKRKF